MLCKGYGGYLARLWSLYQLIAQLQKQLTNALQSLQESGQVWQLEANFNHARPELTLHSKCATLTSHIDLQTNDTKSTLAATAILGAVMLLLDKHIPDVARERSIVAYIRLNSGMQSVASQAPGSIRLFAATGYSVLQSRTPVGQ